MLELLDDSLGLLGRDGVVLRITLPYGLLIGLGMGLITLIFEFFRLVLN